MTVLACAPLRNGAHAKTGFRRGQDRPCTAAQAKDGSQTVTFSSQPLRFTLKFNSNQLLVARLLHSCPTWTRNFLQYNELTKTGELLKCKELSTCVGPCCTDRQLCWRGQDLDLHSCAARPLGHMTTVSPLRNLMQLKYLSRVTKYLQLHISSIC